MGSELDGLSAQMAKDLTAEIDEEIMAILNNLKCPWLEEGAIFVVTNVYPSRVFTVKRLLGQSGALGEVTFDAISVVSGDRLQGYSFRPDAKRPSLWLRINEMEALAYASMTQEEWLAQRKERVRRWDSADLSPRRIV